MGDSCSGKVCLVVQLISIHSESYEDFLIYSLFDDRLNPAHLAINQADLDAVGVSGAVGEKLNYNAFGHLTGELIMFFNDHHPRSGLDFFACGYWHSIFCSCELVYFVYVI
jgi:hypothetical protein